MSLDDMSLDLSEKSWRGSSDNILVHRRNGGYMTKGRTHYADLHRRLIKADGSTYDEVEKIGDEILELAHDKNQEPFVRLAAMKLWLDHVVGRPRTRVEVDHADSGMDVDTIMSAIMLALDDESEAKLKIAAVLRHIRLSQLDESVDADQS